jgi:hypothetical protein
MQQLLQIHVNLGDLSDTRRSPGAAAVGEAIVLGSLGAGFRCDAHVVSGDGFAPHIPLQARVGAACAAGEREHDGDQHDDQCDANASAREDFRPRSIETFRRCLPGGVPAPVSTCPAGETSPGGLLAGSPSLEYS